MAELPPGLEQSLQRLLPFRAPSLVLLGLRLGLPTLAPSLWRSITLYRRLTPVLLRYLAMKTFQVSNKRDAKKQLMWKKMHARQSVKVADILVDVGGFYLKLGQVLASKADLLPPEYCAALGRLFGDLPPYSFDVIYQEIETELDEDPQKVFEWISEKPLATATIAQVHRAVLATGEPVVVKVCKPGIR